MDSGCLFCAHGVLLRLLLANMDLTDIFVVLHEIHPLGLGSECSRACNHSHNTR